MGKLESFGVQMALPYAFLLMASCTPSAPSGVLCPPVPAYSAYQQKGTLAELNEHPDLKFLPSMLRDYDVLRDQLKACRG